MYDQGPITVLGLMHHVIIFSFSNKAITLETIQLSPLLKCLAFQNNMLKKNDSRVLTQTQMIAKRKRE